MLRSRLVVPICDAVSHCTVVGDSPVDGIGRRLSKSSLVDGHPRGRRRVFGGMRAAVRLLRRSQARTARALMRLTAARSRLSPPPWPPPDPTHPHRCLECPHLCRPKNARRARGTNQLDPTVIRPPSSPVSISSFSAAPSTLGEALGDAQGVAIQTPIDMERGRDGLTSDQNSGRSTNAATTPTTRSRRRSAMVQTAVQLG